MRGLPLRRASRRTPWARSCTTRASSRSSRRRASETVDSLDDVDHGAAVVIRAHGVTPEVMARAEERGLEVIDGTCTWVIQEQRELQKLVDDGYTIVLLGTPRHPEVVGLLGFAPDAIVVDEEEDWQRIPRTKRMALISQSTQPPWKFEKLAAFLVGRCHELKVVNTVCPVTIRRQQDTHGARRVGRHDGRRRWTEQRQHPGADAAVRDRGQARHPDRGRGRPQSAAPFAGARVVGVTGGTSTPIEDLETGRPSASTSWPAAHRPSARAAELAHAALTAVAEPAYRSTSLDEHGRQRRTSVAGAA